MACGANAEGVPLGRIVIQRTGATAGATTYIQQLAAFLSGVKGAALAAGEKLLQGAQTAGCVIRSAIFDCPPPPPGTPCMRTCPSYYYCQLAAIIQADAYLYAIGMALCDGLLRCRQKLSLRLHRKQIAY